MNAGKLRHRITIEQPTDTQDAYGEPIPAWSTLAIVWAEKEDLAGSELFQAQQVNARISTRFTIRHRADVTAKMRVDHGSVKYDVESVQDPDGRKEELVLLCGRSAN